MFSDFAKNHQTDGFVCGGVLPDAHFGRASLAPTVRGAQKIKGGLNENH
jgi:hypothetical protein